MPDDEATEAEQVAYKEGYYDGVKDGIRAHAIWRDGEQLVGAMQKPIAEVMSKVTQFKRLGKLWRF